MNSIYTLPCRATSILSAHQRLFLRASWRKTQPVPFAAPRTHYHASATSASMDYASIATPAACYADFCLIPVGTGSVSVAAEVAEVQRVLKASGLKYTMHSAGTTVEGSWDDVMAVIGKAHAVVHQRGVVRVQSSMRVGSRTDKKQTAEDKVKRVTDLLAEDAK